METKVIEAKKKAGFEVSSFSTHEIQSEMKKKNKKKKKSANISFECQGPRSYKIKKCSKCMGRWIKPGYAGPDIVHTRLNGFKAQKLQDGRVVLVAQYVL